MLGLVGESGSGKTTVGLAVLGHTRRGARIARGEVRIEGRDILPLPPLERQRLRGRLVSYVPQDPASALSPAMRIGRQLDETLSEHGFGSSDAERRERIVETLGEVLLPSDETFLRRYPHQLSGGQQQRVALAMAFANRPRVIVLDEPTTGLDVTTQAHVLETVRALCAMHGVAAVYVSHDLAVVATLATRVAVMYAGRLVEVGPDRDAVPARPRIPTRDASSRPSPSCRESTRSSASRARHRGRGIVPPAASSRHAAPTRRSACAMTEPAARDDRRWTTRSAASATPTSCATRRPRGRRRRRGRRSTLEDALVTVLGVDASYGARQVLYDVELLIRPRECLALVGESGSGKTTLARCIAGLHAGYTGAIAYRGQPLEPGARARDANARREIQYVFQSPYNSLNPRKTIGQIVGQPLAPLLLARRSRDARRRVIEALESRAALLDVLDRYPHQLSGGERQRVAIARALDRRTHSSSSATR